jgi:hypothetical protein
MIARPKGHGDLRTCGILRTDVTTFSAPPLEHHASNFGVAVGAVAPDYAQIEETLQ